MFRQVMIALKKNKTYFNELDALVGDGDTGDGVERAVNRVMLVLNELDLE